MMSLNGGTLLQLRFESNFAGAGAAWQLFVDQSVRKKRGRSIKLTAGDVNKQNKKKTKKQTRNKQRVSEKSVDGA